MRIDKFLWYSRIYKSRTIASNACKKGHIKIDLNSIKPSYEVFPNTIIYVKKNQILNQFKIIDLPTSRVGAKIVDIYLLNITSKIELEKKKHYRIIRLVLNLKENQVKKREEIYRII